MTDEQTQVAPRRRVKPVWIVVSLAVLLLLVGGGIVLLQGHRQRQLVELVEQNGGLIEWTPDVVAGLPTPVPFLQTPLQIAFEQMDGPGLRQVSRTLRQISGYGDWLFALGFDNCSFTGEDFATLPDLQQVQLLDFTDSRVDATTIARLDRFPALWELGLASSTIDDHALAALPRLPELTNLWLYETRVRGPGLASLPQQPKLRQLVLINSQITSEGLAALADCSRLESLYLNRTQIDDEAVEFLLRLPALRELGVSNTQLSKQGLGRLREAAPQLKIHGYHW